jgi:16S rRNA processing protein RimM
MTIEECYQLGYVMKAHGYKGEVMVFLDVDNPQEYRQLSSVFVEKAEQLIPFFVQQIQVIEKAGTSQAIVKFEDINNGDQAAELKGCALYLPLNTLPALDDDQFYFHEIIGFTVVDKQLGKLGTVTNVYNLEHQDLIAMDYQNREVLIPMIDDIVLSVDREAQHLEVDLPEGLLDVYLEG